MSGLESDVCKIQHLHVTLEGAIREFQSFQATLLVYILHRGKENKQNCFETTLAKTEVICNNFI